MLSAAAWLLPPAVLPVPSRSGPEGPPRPYGAVPRFGGSAAHTDRKLALAQSRALRYGPFPRSGLVRGVSDGEVLLSSDAGVRALALARIAQTGSMTVRIPVDWRTIATGNPPATFHARDPASPNYNFTRVDAAVRSAAAAGLAPLLVVSHAPAYAEAPGRWVYAYPGSWAPSPAALGDFAAALARRYDGTFPDPVDGGASLPHVHLFQAWNEPNLARYLEPQWIAQGGHWTAFSPLLYRQMLDAFYAGVKAAQPTALVVAAGLAPDGDPAGVGRMAPVSFLRSMLCLEGSARLVRLPCPDPAHFDVLAYHPLSVGDPDLAAASALDIAIADAAKLTRMLASSERLGTALPAGEKPVWVTELNWESAPQNPDGVPPALQARWISRALHRLWIAGISLVQWQFLVDPFPGVHARLPNGTTIEYPRPAGLYSAGENGELRKGEPKAFLRGFSFPFDPLRLDRRHVRVWGLLKNASERVVIQRRVGARQWQTLTHPAAYADGVLNVRLSIRGRATLRLQSDYGARSAPATIPAAVESVGRPHG